MNMETRRLKRDSKREGLLWGVKWSSVFFGG